jgi:hypothetical protein
MDRAETIAARARAAGLSYMALWQRLRRGQSPEEALTTPPRADRDRHRLRVTELAVRRAAARLNSRGIFPTRHRLAAETGRSPASVADAVARLRRRDLADWATEKPSPRRYGDWVQALADDLADDGLEPTAIAREIYARTGLPVHEATVRRWLGRGVFGDDPEAIARRAAEIRRGVAS